MSAPISPTRLYCIANSPVHGHLSGVRSTYRRALRRRYGVDDGGLARLGLGLLDKRVDEGLGRGQIAGLEELAHLLGEGGDGLGAVEELTPSERSALASLAATSSFSLRSRCSLMRPRRRPSRCRWCRWPGRTLPCAIGPSRARIVSSKGVSGSGKWTWYRSMKSGSRHRRLFSSSAIRCWRGAPDWFGPSSIRMAALVATSACSRLLLSVLPMYSSERLSPPWVLAVSIRLMPTSRARLTTLAVPPASTLHQSCSRLSRLQTPRGLSGQVFDTSIRSSLFTDLSVCRRPRDYVGSPLYSFPPGDQEALLP